MTKEHLKAWRTKMKLSQAGLARLMQCTTHTVYQWESGKRHVPLYLDVLLPLVTHAHAAQYHVNRKRRKPRKEHV